MNTQKEILSFSEYIKYIEENYSRNSLFRGLKDKSFALIPKIGNPRYAARFLLARRSGRAGHVRLRVLH